ncbi:MAG: MbnP family protein [Cytophagaceae bacterium]
MKRMLLFLLIVVLSGIAGFRCHHKKPPEPSVPVTSGTLQFEVETDVNGSKLVMNTGSYNNANGDPFTVSTLKYYISNITLKDSLGNIYKVPDSYYLINASVSADTTLSIPNIPVNTYTEIGFSLGVDSLHNHSGSQPAALNPGIAGDMFWLWSLGYKFLEFEGHSASSGSGTILFHISDDVNYKKWVMKSGTTNWTNIRIKDNASSKIKVKADFAEMFQTPVTVDFATMNNVSGGTDAQTISNNYADMFSLSSIVNAP